MDKRKANNFSLKLRAEKDGVRTWLVSTGLVLLVELVLFKFIYNVQFGLLAKILLLTLCLALIVLSVLASLYLLRLYFTKKNKLDLNAEGLVDYASFCSLGAVENSRLDQIRFASVFGLEFVVISFSRKAKVIASKRGINTWVYRRLFGERLWIILDLFRVSRIDLESQIIHLDHLMGKPYEPSRPPPPPTLREVESPKQVLKAVPHETEPIVPPPAPPVSKDYKDPIRAKVDAIRSEVKASGFDHLVGHLYLDHLSQYPMYSQASHEFIPPEFHNVEGFHKGADYEEVSFVFAGTSFQFGLRRDIGASDEALLSVGVGGKVHMSLKVRVEIGVLDPLEVESFRPGDWQKAIYQIKEIIEQFEKNKTGKDLDKTQVITSTKTNLDDLKDRFGLDEE